MSKLNYLEMVNFEQLATENEIEKGLKKYFIGGAIVNMQDLVTIQKK